MKPKRGKRKPVPAIVPRFLKSAVTIGVIPVLAAGCDKPRHVQPVVAQFARPAPEDAMRPPPPVVAAYQAPPVVPPDAAPDATAPKRSVDAAVRRPPPPVVAAMVPRDIGPAVVAAYVPRDRPTVGSGSGSAAPKKRK
jgi:hypothetical protein